MAKPLVVVDSESKGRTIQKQYEVEVDILVVTAPPVVAAHKKLAGKGKGERLLFDFSPLPSGAEFLEALAAYHEGEIYLALDSDQRSEYLAWVIDGYLSSLTKGGSTVRRLNLLGLAGEELRESFRLVDVVREEQALAFYVRAQFNAVLGKHLLRLIGTRVGPGNLPINFNGLTLLFLVAEREYQIKVYSPPVRWQINVKLQFAGTVFFAKLHSAYGVSDDGVFRDLGESRSVVAGFKSNRFLVTEVERSELLIRPPQPYLLADLLVEAQVLYGIGPKKVCAAVESLFHGVEVQGAMTGLLSQFLPLGNDGSESILARIRRQVVTLFGQEMLGEEDELAPGLGLLLPLRPEVEPKDLPESMDAESRQVYALIRERALASQMRPAVGETLQIHLTAGEGYLFSAHCNSITEKNFLHVYQGRYERGLLTPNPLAALAVGQEVENLQIVPEQSRGRGEDYYTCESLFADLLEFSIVLDPGNILLLQQMLDHGYLSLDGEGFLRLQENGHKLVEIMKQVFPAMRGINLSAYIEQTMVEVISGRKLLDSALVHVDQTLMLRGVGILKMKLPVRVPSRGRTSSSVIKVAPAAQPIPPGAAPAESGGMVAEIAIVPEGLLEEVLAGPVEEEATETALAAGGAEMAEESIAVAPGEEPSRPEEEREEEYSAPAAFLPEEEDSWSAEVQEAFEQVLQNTEAREEEDSRAEPPPEMAAEKVDYQGVKLCQICGKPMLLKKDRFGKFWSCSAFPACRHSESYREEDEVMLCPLCQVGKVILKRTPTGKNFYVCPDRNCDFMAWSPPHATACPVCASPFLVEKKSASGEIHLRCPRAGCDYTQPLAGAGEELAEEVLEDGEAAAAPARKMVRVRRVAKGTASSSGGTKKVRVVRRK